MKFTLSLCILLAASAGIASAEVIYESQFNRGDWQDPREKRPSYPSATQRLDWKKNLNRTNNRFIYGGGEYPTKEYTSSAAPTDYTTSRLKPLTRPSYSLPKDEPYSPPDASWIGGGYKFRNRVAPPTYGSYRSFYGDKRFWNPDDEDSGRLPVFT